MSMMHACVREENNRFLQHLYIAIMYACRVICIIIREVWSGNYNVAYCARLAER